MRPFWLSQLLTADQNYGAAQPFLAKLQLLSKVGPMVWRGLWIRLGLKHSAGIILVGKGVAIRNPQYVSTGHTFVAEDYCEVQGLSEEGIIFGDHVTIGRFAMIRPSGYYGRKIGVGLKVGNYSNIGAYSYIGCAGGITIGNNVLMGPRVSLFAENHNFERIDLPIRDQGVTYKRIVVEDDCWLASSSSILAGVHIGRGSIVVAGSVVTHDVPAYSIVAGSPARIVRSRLGETR